MRVVRNRGTCPARVSRTLVWGLALLVAGCHGRNTAAPGTPVVTLGSTNANFASYIVSIDSIVLTASDGTFITLLSPAAPEVVDLVKISDLSELLQAPAVPSGTYISAQITVDYTSADIWLNVNGHAVLCKAQSPSGATLGIQTITVTFDPTHPLVITQGVSNRVALEFDLAASSFVLPTSTPVVTVEPFITMRAVAVDSTVLRARGLLVISQPASNNFIMNVRPLYDLLSGGFGALTVNTTAQTYFNIDGVTYTGSAGLNALTQLTVDASVAAYGTLDNLSGITPTFNATAVYAGTSLESPILERVIGVITARSGDTLTVRGQYFTPLDTFIFANALTTLGFADSIAVTLGSGTIVSEDGVAANGLTLNSPSVGQQIEVSGQGSVGSGGAISLNATQGQLRLASSHVWGLLNSATAGSLSMNALSFANFDVSGFNFAGTGAGGQNATPANYQVSTGSLDVTAIPAPTLIRVDGIVAPFGSAPPDFRATAVTPDTSVPQTLEVEWVKSGTAKPFTKLDASGLVVNLSDPNMNPSVAGINTGPAYQPLPANVLITTPAGQSDLRLAVGSSTASGGISMFATFPELVTAIHSKLTGSTTVAHVVAVGQYDSATHSFVASAISVGLHE
jgi:hypothetical protein